jgi:hypothetical protein
MKNIGRLTTLSMAFMFALPHAAHAQTVAPPPVPASLEVPAPNEAFLLGRGVGTQNYICQPSASIGRVAWTLFTPQATLFSDQREQLTTHFFSPNPCRGRHRTRHLAGLPGHEHRVGAGNRFRRRPERVGRDCLASTASGWNQGGADRGQHTVGSDIYPAAEYRRRVGARDRL